MSLYQGFQLLYHQILLGLVFHLSTLPSHLHPLTLLNFQSPHLHLLSHLFPTLILHLTASLASENSFHLISSSNHPLVHLHPGLPPFNQVPVLLPPWGRSSPLRLFSHLLLKPFINLSFRLWSLLMALLQHLACHLLFIKSLPNAFQRLLSLLSSPLLFSHL